MDKFLISKSMIVCGFYRTDFPWNVYFSLREYVESNDFKFNGVIRKRNGSYYSLNIQNNIVDFVIKINQRKNTKPFYLLNESMVVNAVEFQIVDKSRFPRSNNIVVYKHDYKLRAPLGCM